MTGIYKNPDYSLAETREIKHTFSEPSEVLERRRLRELKEKRDGELLKNADRVTSTGIFFLKLLGISVAVDLFYWLAAFTPHGWLIKIIGPLCSVGEIVSITGIIILFIYSFVTGTRICKIYDSLVTAFDREMVSEIGW